MTTQPDVNPVSATRCEFSHEHPKAATHRVGHQNLCAGHTADVVAISNATAAILR